MTPAYDYSRRAKQTRGGNDPAAKDALVNGATALVAACQEAELEEPAASALALLALVAGQDVEPAGGSDGTGGRWRIARKVAAYRVVSAVDPDAPAHRQVKRGQKRRLPGAPGRVAPSGVTPASRCQGLRGNLAGCLQQPGQVVDCAPEPAPAPARSRIPLPGGDQGCGSRLGAAQRPPRAGQQRSRRWPADRARTRRPAKTTRPGSQLCLTQTTFSGRSS